MAPFELTELLGGLGSWLPSLAIGFLFGFILESSGFADSRKLAGQFYFTENTVLKVMFTSIIVNMVLIFWATAIGFLNYDLIWVNPTYFWPGIIGGLIMGVGFIIGGYCPGTSLASLSTFKIDGLFFVLGALFGIFLFGETVEYYNTFWTSSFMGRFTLQDWLGVDAGIVVFGVVLMAIFMFWGSEKIKSVMYGKGDK